MSTFLLGFALYAGLDGQYPEKGCFGDLDTLPSREECQKHIDLGRRHVVAVVRTVAKPAREEGLLPPAYAVRDSPRKAFVGAVAILT